MWIHLLSVGLIDGATGTVPPVVVQNTLGGVWLGKHRYKGLDAETEEEKEARRIAAGLIPPKAEAVVRKAVIVKNDDEAKALYAEFMATMAAQIESERIRRAVWELEKRRVEDDEAAALLLLH